MIHRFLLPLSVFYVLAVEIRRILYKLKIFNSRKLPVSTISVGNITSGGTGKTPFVVELTRILADRGQRVAVLSRGYRRKSHGCLPVVLANPRSLKMSEIEEFGDEPTFIKKRLPSIPVWVGNRRFEAGQQILSAEAIDTLILDDAFQHWSLARDIDIVIIDATENEWRYLPLPAGRARESFSALKRAKLVILNKVNLVSEIQVLAIKSKIERYASADSVFMAVLHVRFARLLGTDDVIPMLMLKEKYQKLFSVNAIARPENFRKSLNSNLVGYTEFADHHFFSASELLEVERRALELGAQAIFVSEKDATKLDGWNCSLPVYVTQLELELVGGWEPFYAKLSSLLS